MDLTKLATQVTVFMTPFLPYLVSGGEAAMKEIGKRFGETAWEEAKALWNKVRNPNLEGVARALADDPEDEDLQVALAKLLVKQMSTSPELAEELMHTLNEDSSVQTILVEQGSRVEDILQRLSRPGTQETIIRGSQAGDITQEQ
jgi:hypothetical protein